MESLSRLIGRAASLPAANIDTDIIFPARFLLLTQKKGLGRYAFFEWRYRPDGSEAPGFPLNQDRFRGAPFLVAGDNFGCGSSREHAPWALRDLGVRCVISSRFGEIFHSNCFKNGIAPVVVSPKTLATLQADAEAGAEFTLDLPAQVLMRANGEAIPFVVEDWRRDALVNGWDEIALVLNHDADAIAAFETRQRTASPWLFQNE